VPRFAFLVFIYLSKIGAVSQHVKFNFGLKLIEGAAGEDGEEEKSEDDDVVEAEE
jgi:hypothetical protein